MAWRIDEAVVRGEIDNRERGRVRGQIWLVGRESPVVLDLKGNAWRDVAGRRLVFENPTPKAMDLDGLDREQAGAVGDITASRKVKMPEIPMDQIGEYYAAKKPWPWHWGNCLYLEWHSQKNGRVVIESAAFDLRIEGEPAWEMTEAEEADQREANGRAMVGFMERLGEAFADDQTEASEDDLTGAESAPMTEAEAEAEQARNDLLLDRVQARMRREGEEADFSQILAEERERLRVERGEPEPPAEWEEGYVDWAAQWDDVEAEAAECDLELEERASFEHPLVRRAFALFEWLHEQAESEKWIPDGAQAEHPVRELIDSAMSIAPKLAGALNSGDWPPELDFCAHTIVRLKRAHGYAEDAICAAESCQEDKLIEARYLGSAVVELADIVHEIEALIAELRERLEKGRD